MMAVNSWLITIKRRIKLPLVPPGVGSGGDAAISSPAELAQYTFPITLGSNVLQQHKEEIKTNFILV